MNVIIAGVGHLGAQIAEVLLHARNHVTVVEVDDARLAVVRPRLKARLVAGDACEPAILEEAGVHNADLLVAATGDDEDNLVISLLAKRQFAVARVVARVNDPDNEWLFDTRWGVDVAVPAEASLISLIEEATDTADTVALMRLSRARVNVIETSISVTSRAAGQLVGDIVLPRGTIVAAVIRDGQPTVPNASFRLQPHDELLLVSQAATDEDVRIAFQ